MRGLAKEAFDRVFALCALIGLSPVMLTVAALVKLSSRGPVLFTQPRLGVDGKVFRVYKFRTMTVHQEHGVVTQATRGDARVTRIGAFCGAPAWMSCRNSSTYCWATCPWSAPAARAGAQRDVQGPGAALHDAPPRQTGITGWAQVNGFRGQTDTLRKMSDRVEHDLYYIQHWTFRMDLRIIARTAISGWTGRNVY